MMLAVVVLWAAASGAADPDPSERFVAQYAGSDVVAIERAADKMPGFQAALLFRAMTLARAADQTAEAKRIAAKLAQLAPQSPLVFEAREILDEGSSGGGERASLVTFKSEPAAVVMIDNAAVGMTPFTVRLEPGAYAVAFKRSGYEPSRRNAEVAAGEVKTIRATLEPPEVRRGGIPERDSQFFNTVLRLLGCRCS